VNVKPHIEEKIALFRIQLFPGAEQVNLGRAEMAIDTVRYAAQEIEKFSPIPNVEDESCREEIVDINFKFVEEVGLNKSPLHPCEDLRRR
jgi:hypothetical protein